MTAASGQRHEQAFSQLHKPLLNTSLYMARHTSRISRRPQGLSRGVCPAEACTCFMSFSAQVNGSCRSAGLLMEKAFSMLCWLLTDQTLGFLLAYMQRKLHELISCIAESQLPDAFPKPQATAWACCFGSNSPLLSLKVHTVTGILYAACTVWFQGL